MILHAVSGRTEKMVSVQTGEMVNATVFAAIAAEDKVYGGYLHVERNRAQTSMGDLFVVSA